MGCQPVPEPGYYKAWVKKIITHAIFEMQLSFTIWVGDKLHLQQIINIQRGLHKKLQAKNKKSKETVQQKNIHKKIIGFYIRNSQEFT